MGAGLTLTQLFQLYAPLAGLLVLAFWVGGLSQRVKQLEKDAVGDEMRDKLTRLDVHMENAQAALEKMERQLQVVHRQLANIATGRVGVATIISPED